MKKTSFKILIIFFILTFAGFLSLKNLIVKLNPEDHPNNVTVSFSLEGASSYHLELNATSKLESIFSTIRGVKKISSISSKNNGFILLEFEKNIDLEFVRLEISNLIRQIKNQLPENLSYPSISLDKGNLQDTGSFLSYKLNADEESYEIYNTIINQVIPLFSDVSELDEINIDGINPLEYKIEYNSEILKKLSINRSDIVESIKSNIKSKSLGEISYDNDFIQLSIQKPHNFNWIIPIKKVANKIIYLNQVATIKKVEQNTGKYFRVNGENAISISFVPKENVNSIELAKLIEERMLLAESAKLPKHYSITKTYDSSAYLKREINKVYKRAIFSILILLLFILLVSKSIRYLLVILLSLTANLGCAFLLYNVFNIEIHIYSLAAIAISLGLIMDNSIMMIHHIKSYKNINVFIPILSSTITTIGSVAVVFFIDNSFTLSLYDFSSVLIINLLISIVTSLFLIPTLLDKIRIRETKNNFLRKIDRFEKYYVSAIRLSLRFKKIIIGLTIIIFGIPFFLLPKKLEKNDTYFEKLYNNTFGSEWYNENARTYVNKYLGGTFRLFNDYVYESSQFRENKESKLYLRAFMEKGANDGEMNEIILTVEKYLSSFQEIEQYITRINDKNNATVEIIFNSEDQKSSFPYKLKSSLISKVVQIGGVEWNIIGVGQAFGNSDGTGEPINFTVKAQGFNYNTLNSWMDTLRVDLEQNSRIQKVLKTSSDLSYNKPSYEYEFVLNDEFISLYNRSKSSIIDEIKFNSLSNQADFYSNINNEYIPIRLESDNSNNYDFWKIKKSPFDSISSFIKLDEAIKINKVIENQEIRKVNQEYISLLQYQYLGKKEAGNKLLKKKLDEINSVLPLGYKFSTSEFNAFSSTNNFKLLLIILCLIYITCAVLFESLRLPFIVLSVIPISFIGVFLTFYLFDFSFDQGGLISFVLLCGIAVNSSIFILYRFKKLRSKSNDSNSLKIYIEAFKQKIFPIVLSIFSTILGFIPFITDGEDEAFWFSLGVGTIGGLVFSIIGVFIYLPLFTLKRKSLSLVK